jgi:hypothetical protein
LAGQQITAVKWERDERFNRTELVRVGPPKEAPKIRQLENVVEALVHAPISQEVGRHRPKKVEDSTITRDHEEFVIAKVGVKRSSHYARVKIE